MTQQGYGSVTLRDGTVITYCEYLPTSKETVEVTMDEKSDDNKKENANGSNDEKHQGK